MSLNALDMISRTFRLYGTLPAGDTPDNDDASVALEAFNAMKRAWFGTLIGPRLGSFSLSGTSGQAENGGEYVIPAGAAFALSAPGNPRPGARFGVVDVNADFATYPCTILRNGRLVNGAAANLSLVTNGQAVRFWYRGDTGNWVEEGDTPTLTSTLEFPDTITAYLPYMLAVAGAAEFSAPLTPEIEAANLEGRAVLARTYGRRGRGQPEGPIGLAQPQQAQG